ncbi:LysM peptidoglycan-binding domain-containing protein [Streptomyces niveus]|uniref:LysM peptidoglycan-binding domain-containing protein n=1 Tax=Streptomyces niveus TaxID=193462 RepID=UPI0035E02917
MAHRTPAPLRALGSVLRALLGLALLTALTVGVPYLLLTVGHQPTELTGGWDLLTQRDDGSLFLVVLTCIGWAGWAAFTFSVLVELVAVLRRRSAPRIRTLGPMQAAASFLIGGIVLLAPTAASAATATSAVAVTVTQTVGETTPSTSTAPAADETDRPQHTVTSATELPWDLAEEYLGDGKRWKDIAALNPDVPGLASGDQFLPKDAVITLPADARPVAEATSPEPAASTTTQAPAPDSSPIVEEAPDADADETKSAETAEGDTAAPGEHTASVTVRAGDSLWSIADAHGEPTDWPEIYAANKGEPQPGGGQFDNPNLIYPGQELDLPAADKPAEPPANPGATTPPTGDTPHAPPAPDPDTDAGAEQERDDAQPPPPATTGPAPSRTAEPSPEATRTPPAPSRTPDAGDRTTPSRHADDQEQLAPAAVWMGAGVLAAALVGTLGVRRRLQQRRLRPGRRIPMPQGRAAATEQSLRAAQHPTGFDLLDAALRSLALNLADARRDLPVIEAVVLHESKVELHLDQDTTPMKPFSAAAGRQDMWICAASSPGLADEETLQAADAPYPALVSIGWDNQGHLVLVDLEHVGILQLAGDQTYARHVLQAIAVELANTPLPGHMEVAALGEAVPGLESAAPERVLRTTDLAVAVADLSAHAADQRRALAGTGTSSLRQARLREDAAGAWTPHIVLAADLPHGADSDLLVEVLNEQPRTAAAVITTTPALTGTERSGVWTLHCQGPDHTIVLPGSGLPVHLQGLSDEHYQDAVELLTLAASDADVPAPAWVTSHDDETPNEDGDGLPAEYADLEDEEIAVQATHPARTAQTPDTPAAGHGADILTLEKPAVEAPAVRPDDEPAGPSLAEVLAQDDDHGDHGPHPDFSTWVMQPEPEPPTSPTPPTSPCAPAPREAVHATLPPATPPTPEPESATVGGPAVLLLGPIAVEGATGRLDSNRRRRGIELAAFLALNPGVDHHAIDDALWPGQLVNKQMRNSVISRTRSWLDKDPDGNAHFPRVQDTGDSRYRLGPKVTCDWSTFQKHARKGLADQGEDGDLSLRRALALVRGRPFTGIDPGRYAWAEPAVQEMVSAITHVAYELSTRRREAGDYTSALWAARTGLLAAEENETLHRQIFLAHHAAGDMPALRLAAATLAKINERLGGGVDMDAETAELLRNLLPHPTRTR